MKHFALCLNDKYVPYACVTIQSILMHHRKENVTFHLITDGFTERKKSGMNIFTSSNHPLCRLCSMEGKSEQSPISLLLVGGFQCHAV